jgi:beta-xylosidase
MSQSGADGWDGGLFANPVIAGFYPDPSVCRAGDDYYLACSSFEYFPGVPVFHSRDLVHWEQIGNGRQWPLPETTPSSGGVYAPTLRHHDGLFWLITADASGSTVLVTAANAAGPWSEPRTIAGVNGVDPDIAWDDEGRCWCTYAGIEQVRIDPGNGRVLGEPRRIWSGTQGARHPEAPHLYRIADFWYLLIAEGGTERGHCVSVARSLSPDGPVRAVPGEPCAEPSQHLPDGPEHRARGPDPGTRRVMVDGAARGTATRRHPRLAHARAGDVPRTGDVDRRLALSR